MDENFQQTLAAGGMVGDGAMGSLLYERGIFVNRNFDELNLSQPELIFRVHREYLHAGAQVLETNTYGANRIRLARHGLEEKIEAINQAATQQCKQAAQDKAFVAGSIGPTGLKPDELRRKEDSVRDAFAEQVSILTAAGCDTLFIETFAYTEELQIAVQAARAHSKLPIVSLVQITPEGKTLNNTAPDVIAKQMQQWGADVVGANCNGARGNFRICARHDRNRHSDRRLSQRGTTSECGRPPDLFGDTRKFRRVRTKTVQSWHQVGGRLLRDKSCPHHASRRRGQDDGSSQGSAPFDGRTKRRR